MIADQILALANKYPVSVEVIERQSIKIGRTLPTYNGDSKFMSFLARGVHLLVDDSQLPFAI